MNLNVARALVPAAPRLISALALALRPQYRQLRFALLLLTLTAPLLADLVTLSNGDRVTGKIVKKDGANLVVKTDLMGDVTIPWKSVSSVTSDAALHVVLPGDKKVDGPLSTVGNQVQVAGATAPLADVAAIRNDAEQRNYERFLNPGVFDLWAGYFDLGLSLARGNASTTTFSNSFKATRATSSDKTSAYFNQIYANATLDGRKATSAEAIRGGWAYNRNLTPRFLFNVFNDYEYDRFQNLDLRFVLGGGAGFTAIKNERTRLDLPFGFAYNREKFNTPLTRKSGEFYWGDDFIYKLNGATSLSQSYRIFHNLTNGGEYRVNFDLGATTAIKNWIAWQVTASDRFLSNPVAGRKRNDVLLTTGFRFSFAR